MKALQLKNIPRFESWFNSTFYQQLYANRDQKEAVDFIDNLMEELALPYQSRIMDLGCGTGRHARYLASHGHHVTGADLSISSIRTARKFESDNLHFFRHDMRKPFGNNHYDYVFNFFTSFGYFKTDEENQLVVSNIAGALKPGGILMMDYLNPHVAEQNLVPAEQKEIDGVIYKIARWADTSHIFKKIRINNVSGEKFEYVEQVAKIYLHQFKVLFERGGLRLHNVYGDYQLNRYDAERSPRLIMTAVKQ